MANIYCTATHTGHGFFTYEDRINFYLSGQPGDVWVVGDNAQGAAWVSKVSGIPKTKVEAQAIVDGKVEEALVAWDAFPEAEKSSVETEYRPVKYIIP